MGLRKEWVYLVVTINKRSNSYRLVKKQPNSLAANEICYGFQVTIDEEEWFEQIKMIEMPPISRPQGNLGLVKQFVGTPEASRVMNRLKGEDIQTYTEQLLYSHQKDEDER